MGFEHTWRWFGPNDPITLNEIKQTGATGIVTALHQIPPGEIWPVDEILARKKMIEAEELTWSVVESVPVHENIKKRKNNFQSMINNYRQTIINLGECGIDTACYNFMPVLDWSRTDLNVAFRDGSITTKFEMYVFAAFDLFILKRKNAVADYSEHIIFKASEYYKSMNEADKTRLIQTVLFGLPGSLQAYTLDEFRAAIAEYENISEEQLRENLFSFIREIIPTAEEAGVRMAIHPDDPPFSLLGLPRIVGSKNDVEKILNAVDSPFNGLTLCTGSFGAGIKNDLADIAKTFAPKINFVHLRNVNRNSDGDFIEENHLEGEIDIYNVMKTLLLEQKKRVNTNAVNSRMPMRPDHGHLMSPDQNRKGIYPGYSLFGRMRGLAELRGMEIALQHSELH